MPYRSFEELRVWKRACRLAVDVYQAVRESADWGFRGQMQRAAVSIPSNIAEGHERGGKDFVRFLRVARGSAAELRTQLYIASELGILPPDRARLLIAESIEISKMLTGLAHSIQRDLKPET